MLLQWQRKCVMGQYHGISHDQNSNRLTSEIWKNRPQLFLRCVWGSGHAFIGPQGHLQIWNTLQHCAVGRRCKFLTFNGFQFPIHRKLTDDQATVDMNELLFNGKIIKADLSYVPGDYDAVIEAIMNGKISSDELQYLVTKRIDMESTVDEGIKELVHFKDRHIKILIRVDKKECLTRDL